MPFTPEEIEAQEDAREARKSAMMRDEIDAYYAEAVDSDGDRHWSDVMMYDGQPLEDLHSEAVCLASCEIAVSGMTFRYYPINLSKPSAEFPAQVAA